MAEAIRKLFVKLFWRIVRAGMTPAAPRWRASAKRSELVSK